MTWKAVGQAGRGACVSGSVWAKPNPRGRLRVGQTRQWRDWPGSGASAQQTEAPSGYAGFLARFRGARQDRR